MAIAMDAFRGMGRRGMAGRRIGVAGVLLALSCSAAAAMGDEWQLNFGPTGGGSSAVTEREKLREIERNPEPGLATLSPKNVAATRAAIKRYTEIVQAGGWPTLPDEQVRPGESAFSVIMLRDRLAISGDIERGGSRSQTLDGTLVGALKTYQTNNGLTPNGRLDRATIAALNVSPEDRLKQLKVNLKRLATLAATTKSHRRYVTVNIPAAQVEAVALDRVVSRHTAVVGMKDRPTPILRSNIYEMNFNPIWRLPPTVIREDLIPRARESQAKGVDLLKKTGINAYDGNGRKVDSSKIDWSGSAPRGYAYRQPAGKDNPLGFVKINFANSESVYMHDSPTEGLFGRNFRAASSGCIRVHNIERLAYWLLGQNDGWDQARVEKMKETGKRADVRLASRVPLHFAYITAWATEDGAVHFRRDLYNRDGVADIATSY